MGGTQGSTNRRRLLQASLALASLSLSPAVGSAVSEHRGSESQDVVDSDWTMWRFNRNNTGINSHIPRVESFTKQWDEPYTPSTQDGNLYSPSVAEGTVYYGTFDEQMHAIDGETGENIWTASTDNIIQSSPTILDGTVYSGSHDGHIYAWDAETGNQEWRIEGGGEGNRHTSVTVSADGGTIYVGSDQTCFSLVPEDGDVNWTFDSPNHLVSSPTVSGNRIYFGSGAPEDDGDGYVHALIDHGDEVEELWRRYFPDGNVRSTIAVSDGYLFFTTLDTTGVEPAESQHDTQRDDIGVQNISSEAESATLWALNAENGSVAWKYGDGGGFSSPAVGDGKVYAGIISDAGSEVVAVTVDDGEVVWRKEIDGIINSSPAFADGGVYIGGGDGYLYALDATNGDVLDRIELGGEVFSPAVSDGEVYVANDKTEVYGISAEMAESPQGIEGSVTDVDGQPVEGATVALVDRTKLFGVMSFADNYGEGDEMVDEYAVATTTTDENGEYEITEVESDGYAMCAVPPEEMDAEPDIRGIVHPIYIGTGLRSQSFELDNRELGIVEEAAEALLNDLEGLAEGNTSRAAEISSEMATEFDVIDDGIDMIVDTVTVFSDVPAGVDPNVVHSYIEGRLNEPDISIDAEFNGLPRVIRNVFNGLGEEEQEELRQLARMMTDEEWVRQEIEDKMQDQIEEFFQRRDRYESTAEIITEQRSQVDELTQREPHEEFDSSVVESRIEEFRQQLRGNGIPGAILTPAGNVYQYSQTEAYARSFENTQTAIDIIETTEKVAHVTQAVGIGLMATKVGAPIGALLWKVGSKFDTATDFAEPIAEHKLIVDFILMLFYWRIDLDKIESITADLFGWLDDAVDSGVTSVTRNDVEIIDVDLNLEDALLTDYVRANQPDDPAFGSRIPGIGDPLWAVEEATVTVKNHSSQSMNLRIAMYDLRQDGEAASSTGALSPGPDEDPFELAPEAEETFTVEYTTAHMKRLRNHTMMTMLYVDGEALRAEQTTFNVRAPELVGGSAHSEAKPVTANRLGHNQTLSPYEEEDETATETTVIESELTPDSASISEVFTTAADTDNVTFLLVTNGNATLRVYDEQGRPVGFDPSQEVIVNDVPDATYTGPNSLPEIVSFPGGPARDFTVEVTAPKFIREDAVEVEVQAIEVPNREALLSASPAESYRWVASGGTERLSVETEEIGEQVGVENVTVSVGEFKNASGTELPSEISISVPDVEFDISPGETESLEVIFDAEDDITLPEGESGWFEGELTVDTENAGSLSLWVSLLVMESNVDGARLRRADQTINHIELTEHDPADIDFDSPVGVEIDGVYEFSVDGEGAVNVVLPHNARDEWRFGYAVDETWSRIDAGTVDGQIELNMDADDTDGQIVIARNELRRYENINGNITTQEIGDAIEDWRAGEIDNETLDDLVEVWERGGNVE